MNSAYSEREQLESGLFMCAQFAQADGKGIANGRKIDKTHIDAGHCSTFQPCTFDSDKMHLQLYIFSGNHRRCSGIHKMLDSN